MQPNSQLPNQPIAPNPRPTLTTSPSFPFPARNVLQPELQKAESEFLKDYKSPAFWMHCALQIAAWLGYMNTTSDTIRIGAFSLSAAAFVSYLIHLTVVKKS